MYCPINKEECKGTRCMAHINICDKDNGADKDLCAMLPATVSFYLAGSQALNSSGRVAVPQGFFRVSDK